MTATTSSQLPPHAATLPLIGVSASVRELEYRFHGTGEKALHAVYEAFGGLPLMLPALGDKYDFTQLAGRLDGLLLTGSPSHVAPGQYGGAAAVPGNLLDPARDATILPLIRSALAAGVPILALCRGMQELNVALGGTLRALNSGKATHSSDGRGIPVQDWLLTHPHTVTLQPGSALAGVFGAEKFGVNSAHSQVIDRLSDKLLADGLSDDGVVEVVSVRGSEAFAVGVQWHPEYTYGIDAQSTALFAAFGAATRHRLAQRLLHNDPSARLDSGFDAVGANLGN